MINSNKWINSLPGRNKKNYEDQNQIDTYRWVNTIPKKKKYSEVKKYSGIMIFFVCGLLLVPAVKNETRNLEKIIDSLKATNNSIKYDLKQANLDHAVITSPENISLLAKEYLNTNFVFYNKSQIKSLDSSTEAIETLEKKDNKVSENVKKELKKRIREKKEEINKLKKLYAEPEEIPGAIKTKVVNKIEEKKSKLKTLYDSPRETFSLKKAQKWAAVQVVKAFLGMPVIPGK